MSAKTQPTLPSGIKDPELLLQILDLLPTSVFVKNENLAFEFSNAAHCDLIGAPADKLLGFSDADFYPAEEARSFLERDRQVLEQGCVLEIEETATGQNREPIPVLTRKRRLVTASGKTYLIGTNTDLSEIRKREAELAIKEARYRALAEIAPVGIWQVDETLNTVYVNPFLLELFDLTEEEFRAASHGTRMTVAETDDLAQVIGRGGRFETDLVCDGKVRARVMGISSGWLNSIGGGSRSAIVTFVDLTQMNDLRAINDQVTRLNVELAGNVRKLKEAQDEIIRKGKLAQLGQLTATVAHELRNPLAAVRTSAFLLERKLKDKGLDIGPQLERISNGVVRCDSIITQLLDYARSNALEYDTLAFDRWLANLVQEEKFKLPAVVKIECRYGLGDLEVTFDPVRLSRVFLNLISNASEAMVGKGDDPDKFCRPDPAIFIETRATERGIEVVVRDNGPGMPPEVLEKVREPLFTTKSFGTGLGLPAVEKILDQHGGGLEIESTPGNGACFTAWLPLAPADSQRAAA